ncbi:MULTISPECIES: TlpA family protein disulfide reductase [Legionella]|uniref:Thiol-disulfide oxidoreductase ResA n=1 Tax=Legionella maceachernii TaxID=466 RepID=A0A0W0VVT3_9GAMM|nr:TlpA disulfide reductase family protein [Legionella maceachernii]KTD24065.1 thiol-disulfide oxidoreductase ResA [Legionella maceachernii]SJZ85305.1 Thiol-disulfide isomerase or thioredoxin [Legionella maceachernii]SUO99241.1 Thiol-disulfide oxidoreductase resA [Legionella maceachernii]
MRCIPFILSLFVVLFTANPGNCSSVILKDTSGHRIPFDSLKGKWVLINYWASWCQPCLDEIAELNRFYKKSSDKVALFAVNYDSLPLSHQLALIRKYNISYPSLQYNPARELKLGDIRGVPATFVFSPEGKLRDALYGNQTVESLNRAIRSNS